MISLQNGIFSRAMLVSGSVVKSRRCRYIFFFNKPPSMGCFLWRREFPSPQAIPKGNTFEMADRADATKLRQGKDVKIEDLNASSGPN